MTRDVGGAFVTLRARRELPKGAAYEELALLGPGEGGALSFWSFTSDGKRSQGGLAEAPDVHPEAIAFEAEMPAGRARMAYRPDGDGYAWAVESRTARGWRRFVEHRDRPAPAGAGGGKRRRAA